MKTNERYLEIFNKLENKTSTKHVNSKILLVDGLNSFIRAFAVNPSMNDNGVHIGGISGFLHTVSYAIRHTNPTRVIIVFDGPGGSIKRKKLFPEYKANRRTKTRIAQHGYYDTYDAERNSMNWQIKRLVEYLNFLPVQSMSVRDIEADDAIGYLCKTEFDDYEKIIMSTDKDFLQLIDKNTKVWSPTKKRLYTVDNMTEDYEVPAHNWAVYRSLTGDVSDNIPGVKGMGLKTIKKDYQFY